MKIVIEDKDVKDAIAVVNDWMGLRYTPAQMLELLEKNPHVVAEMSMFGAFDTVSRETLMDVVGEDLTGRTCPLNMDGDELGAKFYTDLYQAAKEKGIYILQI